MTNVCSVKGGGMTLTLKRNPNGSLEGPQASLRQLNSLVLMTKSSRMINAGPSVQERNQSLSKKAHLIFHILLLSIVLFWNNGAVHHARSLNL